MVSITPTASSAPAANGSRTIWGLDPLQLHTRFWAAHGVQVVRQGEPSEIVSHAELFLLTDPRSLAIFKLSGKIMDVLNWVQPQVLTLRLHDTRERGYRERVVTDENDRFVRFQRAYESADRLARVAITPEREIAQLWQSASDPIQGWRRLRKFTLRNERLVQSIDGQVYDRTVDREIAFFLHDLVRDWKRPDSTIARAGRRQPGTWVDPDAQVDGDAKLIGQVWVGAGRYVPSSATVIGPAIVWDDPQRSPVTDSIQWLQIEPKTPPQDIEVHPETRWGTSPLKRAFDVIFSAIALLFTVPLWPLVALAIWIEDRGKIFFIHTRETLGGREFGCLKFRSMKKNAEQIKKELLNQNQADGPQFWMENDPRLTRVGRLLRKYNIDELPQFWNVLMGDMSIVGPRPSPHKENQFCPAWREGRLSVRPGITGLWQIRRTRRAGTDFQEWIKYDLEYVEKASLWLDAKIIYKTILTMIRKGTRL